jgi:c(7)-type cytochrome triheme protein
MSRLRRIATVVAFFMFVSAATALANVLGNITMNRASTLNGVPGVVFPHWKHRSRFRCYACHPDLFQMQAGANDITMDKLRAGEFCGVCHDGKVAFAIGFNTCRECHSQAEP